MKIETTSDGSHSLRHSLLGELYHSDRGAMGESIHVFIEAGLCYAVAQGKRKITLFEVGFGSGLNAWLTLQRAAELDIQVDYHCTELYPIDLDTASLLNYTQSDDLLALHRAAWGERVQISANFSITKYLCDYSDISALPVGLSFDVVYYDAFAPNVQPELWSTEHFQWLYQNMPQGGAITTYTAKGVVKKAMREAGFTVHRLDGALGKRHMLRAIK